MDGSVDKGTIENKLLIILACAVGCGTDGASVNVSGQNGMRGKLQASLPWLYWAWLYPSTGTSFQGCFLQ